MTTKGIGIRFSYDYVGAEAGHDQIMTLLQGLGYPHPVCTQDVNTGLVSLCAVKFGNTPLDRNEHEVVAICSVLGKWIDVEFYRLRATERLLYPRNGEPQYQKL